MAERLNEQEAAILKALQRGIPLDPRPFAAAGAKLKISETAVLATVAGFFERGLVRRFGAVFDSRSLGYDSTLCAVDAPAAQLEQAAAALCPDVGVTHCYEREGRPNLWFTLTAPANALEAGLQRLALALAPLPILNLPAQRRFKVDVVFDVSAGSGSLEPEAPAPPPIVRHGAEELAGRERALVRRLQASLAVEQQPFHRLAAELGYEIDELLALLRSWKEKGVIRRIGLVARHRNLGFLANGMCVWPVAADRLEAAGKILAGCPEVTHCYERPWLEEVPYNLYAMIHAGTRPAAQAIFESLSRQAGLSGGRMLVSVREFKKASPCFFCEPAGEPAGGRVHL